MLRVDRSTVAELLARSIEQGEGLLERANLIGDFSDYESWKGNRKVWIERTAETLQLVYDGPHEAEDFRAAASSEVPSPGVPAGQQWQIEYRRDSNCVRAAIDVLISLQDKLEYVPDGVSKTEPQPADHTDPEAGSEPEPGPGPGPEQEPERRPEPERDPESPKLEQPQEPQEPEGPQEQEFSFAPALTPPSPLPARTSNGGSVARTGPGQVFIVHGRDERIKQAVADLLGRSGRHEVTVLNERPSDRKMLVEQLTDHTAGSRYAIVLLTADDVGAPRLDSDREPYFSPRARQGVVFEMGVLVAALTPRFMCVLYEDGVELPCDLDGIAYVRLDLAGSWQSKLLLHLRGAGFDYDLNSLAPI
jgi:hypothetical protein